MSKPVTALAVCGPTASGKSGLAVTLSQQLSGEVVNLDSVQVYRDLDIGSAKLSLDERGGVPHHLLDVFEPSNPANVSTFRDVALDALQKITSRKKLPVLVGGSGMYLTVLLHGLAEVPAVDAEIRVKVAEMKADEMHALLSTVDPPTALRIAPRDRQRLGRALEIWFASGKRPSEIFEQHAFGTAEVNALVLVLCRPREELFARIDQRANQMLELGLMGETRRVIDRYGKTSVLSALGYKQACAVLDGTLEEAKVAEEIALHTRRFAKRQMTYWRNEPAKRGWIVRPGPDEEAREVVGLDDNGAEQRRSARQLNKVKSFRALEWGMERLLIEVRKRLAQGLDTTEVWYVVAGL